MACNEHDKCTTTHVDEGGGGFKTCRLLELKPNLNSTDSTKNENMTNELPRLDAILKNLGKSKRISANLVLKCRKVRADC